MAKLCLGGIITVLLLGAVSLMVGKLGLIPTTAASVPPTLERELATQALNASMTRHAPHLTNPYPVNDEDLIAGMRIYTMNCAMCHGALDVRPSPLDHSFYPPAPQLIVKPIHDPEWRTYYVVRTGVRYTGMPAWEGALSDQDMWRVTGFLSRIENLPPGAVAYWHELYGAKP
jgi:mono/diheme cytochrome c family protein